MARACDPIFSNMVMLGALCSTEVMPLDRRAFEQALEGLLPGARLAQNMTAFDRGIESLRKVS